MLSAQEDPNVLCLLDKLFTNWIAFLVSIYWEPGVYDELVWVVNWQSYVVEGWIEPIKFPRSALGGAEEDNCELKHTGRED